jgi:hypothetical protein
MKTGPMKPECVEIRNVVEDVQAGMIEFGMNADELVIRLQQAMSRSKEVKDVLGPALAFALELQEAANQGQEQIKDMWSYGHKQRWEFQQQKDSLFSLMEGEGGDGIEKCRIRAGYATLTALMWAILVGFGARKAVICVA